jgi:hypothetical protein
MQLSDKDSLKFLIEDLLGFASINARERPTFAAGIRFVANEVECTEDYKPCDVVLTARAIRLTKRDATEQELIDVSEFLQLHQVYQDNPEEFFWGVEAALEVVESRRSGLVG